MTPQRYAKPKQQKQRRKRTPTHRTPEKNIAIRSTPLRRVT